MEQHTILTGYEAVRRHALLLHVDFIELRLEFLPRGTAFDKSYPDRWMVKDRGDRLQTLMMRDGRLADRDVPDDSELVLRYAHGFTQLEAFENLVKAFHIHRAKVFSKLEALSNQLAGLAIMAEQLEAKKKEME